MNIVAYRRMPLAQDRPPASASCCSLSIAPLPAAMRSPAFYREAAMMCRDRGETCAFAWPAPIWQHHCLGRRGLPMHWILLLISAPGSRAPFLRRRRGSSSSAAGRFRLPVRRLLRDDLGTHRRALAAGRDPAGRRRRQRAAQERARSSARAPEAAKKARALSGRERLAGRDVDRKKRSRQLALPALLKRERCRPTYLVMSTSLVSRRNSVPMTSVITATITGYHRP